MASSAADKVDAFIAAARTACALVLAGALAGCGVGPDAGFSIDLEWTVAGKSVDGRPILAATIDGAPLAGDAIDAIGAVDAIDGGSIGAPSREPLLLFAAIHGDEHLTPLLLDKLIAELFARPELLDGRRLVIVPRANPDGLARRTRNNAHDVDLNRNFPASTWSRGSRDRHGREPASEPETRALVELVRTVQPARILSVHQPLHCVNYDGPAADLAEAMGRATGYPVKASIGYPTPGSFGSWAGGELGIPVITLEIRGGVPPERLWEEVGPAVLAFILHSEVRASDDAASAAGP